MLISRRSLIASAAGLTAAAAFGARAADKPTPMVIYDDELKNGWQNWSWATVALSVPAGQVKPIKVEGGAWSALALHHDPISTAGFTKLTFFINGGVDGGQSLAIKLKTGDKMIDSNAIIGPLKPKMWQPAEINLKDVGGINQTIDTVLFQGQADAYKPYYITKIQFE